MEKKGKKRPYLGVMFKCCKVYSRIYINKQETAFVGWCPRCARQMRVAISPDGSTSQFFEMT